MQTRRGSIIEVLVNVVIGFSTNCAANVFIYPAVFHREITVYQNLHLGVLFTVLSIARSYTVRRLFNGYIKFLASL